MFNKAGKLPDDPAEGWQQSLYRIYKNGTSNMRVAIYGCKHDASVFETLLQQTLQIKHLGCVSERMIDSACLPVSKYKALIQLCDCLHRRCWVAQLLPVPDCASR